MIATMKKVKLEQRMALQKKLTPIVHLGITVKAGGIGHKGMSDPLLGVPMFLSAAKPLNIPLPRLVARHLIL